MRAELWGNFISYETAILPEIQIINIKHPNNNKLENKTNPKATNQPVKP